MRANPIVIEVNQAAIKNWNVNFMTLIWTVKYKKLLNATKEYVRSMPWHESKFVRPREDIGRAEHVKKNQQLKNSNVINDVPKSFGLIYPVNNVRMLLGKSMG